MEQRITAAPNSRYISVVKQPTFHRIMQLIHNYFSMKPTALQIGVVVISKQDSILKRMEIER